MIKITRLGISYDSDPHQYPMKKSTQGRFSVPVRAPGGHVTYVTLNPSGLAYKTVNGRYIPGRIDDDLNWILNKPNDVGYIFTHGVERTYCPTENVASQA